MEFRIAELYLKFQEEFLKNPQPFLWQISDMKIWKKRRYMKFQLLLSALCKRKLCTLTSHNKYIERFILPWLIFVEKLLVVWLLRCNCSVTLTVKVTTAFIVSQVVKIAVRLSSWHKFTEGFRSQETQTNKYLQSLLSSFYSIQRPTRLLSQFRLEFRLEIQPTCGQFFKNNSELKIKWLCEIL